MISDTYDEVVSKGTKAKQAARVLARSSSDIKNAALMRISRDLVDRTESIMTANKIDIEGAIAKGLAEPMVERLTLNAERISKIAADVADVANLADPIGVVIGGAQRPNGLEITKVRVPLGVIAIIFESRPNVTADAAALCLKSGNAVILRGGSEAINSNIAISKVISQSLIDVGLPAECVQLIETTDRNAAMKLMKLNGLVDCLIPRGGASLIRTVVENATVPVIETGTGNCHIYVDEYADLTMATKIVINAKTSRPSVCNAAETLLVHANIAAEFLPEIERQFSAQRVEVRADALSKKYLKSASLAVESDWEEEFNALIIAVRTVKSLADAVDHITKYGTRHSECIVTENYAAGQTFVNSIDAAAVYINASTRFTDGARFGFGAEIGISNQKLHARGPMGLEELTTYKYIVRGSGQVV